MAMQVCTPFRKIIETSLTIAEITAGADGTAQTFDIGEDLTTDMFVLVHMTDLDADVMFCNAHISAADTLSIRFSNQSAGNITPGATAVKILVF